MSLSNLQGQLAGLNDSTGLTNNKNVGSFQLASTRHDDAIGRGMHHSVQLGYSVGVDVTSTRFKPSVLYDDAKAANDIPLSTLWENCHDALVELARIYPPLQVYPRVCQDQLLQRKTATASSSSSSSSHSLTHLLYSLSALIYEHTDPCLHVLEYLLRRYNIHVHAADTLLVSLLPHCDELPKIFHRVLQLINVANSNHWLWLRPYAVQTVGVLQTPPRHVVAKHVIQNTALLQSVLSFTKHLATYDHHHHHPSTTTNSHSPDSAHPPRGLSQILSWSATIVIQGLVHVQTVELTNSVKESVLRSLLPFIFAACSSNNKNNHNLEWTRWGYLVASVVAETMELSTKIKRVLMNKIAEGIVIATHVKEQQPPPQQQQHHSSNEDDGNDNNKKDEEDQQLRRINIDTVADALTAMTAVGIPADDNQIWNAATTDDDWDWDQYIWLSSKAFTEMVLLKVGDGNNQTIVPQAVAVMYQDRGFTVESLVVCMIMLTVRLLSSKKDDTDAPSNHHRTKKAFSTFLKSLLDEPKLQPLFRNLAKPLADWLVANYIATLSQKEEEEGGDTDEEASSILPLYRQLLQTLRRIHPQGCEEGMAHAMQEQPHKTIHHQKQFAKLLQAVLGTELINTNKKQSEGQNISPETWLPPRVALEHAMASVRLQAIETLMSDLEEQQKQRTTSSKDDNDAMDIDDQDPQEKGVERLEDSLLRRMASDDDEQVVLAAAKAASKLISNSSKTFTTLSKMQIENVLTALYEWMSFSDWEKDKQGKNHLEIVQVSLQILGHVSDTDNDTHSNNRTANLQLVLEALTSHLGHTNKQVAEIAGASLCKILSCEKKTVKTGSKTVEEANHLLLRRHEFLVGLRQPVTNKQSRHEAAIETLRKRSLWVMLPALSKMIDNDKQKDHNMSRTAQAAMDGCLHILCSGDKMFLKSENRIKILQDCLLSCANFLTKTTPEILMGSIVRLASIPVQEVFDGLALSVLKSWTEHVVDSQGKPVSVFAVLMEAVLREEVTVLAVQRILAIVSEYAKNKKHDSVWFAVVPALALLEHAKQSVRLASIDLLSDLIQNFPSKKQHARWRPLKRVCEEVVKNKASATLGGMNFLPTCLSSAFHAPGDDNDNDNEPRESLLTMCLCSAVACGGDGIKSGTEATDSMWLAFGQASGGVRAALSVLDSLELAGEATSPLSQRWTVFGQPILNQLLDTAMEDEDVPLALKALVDSVVKMLKGVAVEDSTSFENIVISSGPTFSGRRQRAYSVGKLEGLSYIDPYPEEMRSSILDVLSVAGPEQDILAQLLCTRLIKELFGRDSWTQTVFAKFLVSEKRKIAHQFLLVLSDESLQLPTRLFYNLPLTSSDLIHLLQERSKTPTSDLASIMILADYIRSNAKDLIEAPGTMDLVSTLFDLLSMYSSADNDVTDEQEFVRHSFVSVICDLLEESDARGNATVAKAKVVDWVNLLLELNGNDTAAASVRPLVSQRAKSTGLVLLTTLCSRFPELVLSSLIPALQTLIKSAESVANDDNMETYTRSTFDSIIPVFWQYAPSAGLSLSDLLTSFVVSVRDITSPKKRQGVYTSFGAACISCVHAKQDDAMIGAVIAAYLAEELSVTPYDEDNFDKMVPQIEVALRMIEMAAGSMQVASVLLLLHYADSLFHMLHDCNEKPSSQLSATSVSTLSSHLPTAETVLSTALTATATGASIIHKKRRAENSLPRQTAIMNLIHGLLVVTNDALLMESMRRFIRRSGRNDAELCLRLWQDLLVVQSTASMQAQKFDDKKGFFESSIRMAGESLEHVQVLLPLPIFLASATSLITEGDAEYLRADAIRLVADRAPEIRPDTPEASLFLDMVSVLIDVLKEPEKISTSSGANLMVLQQSALIAIEHIARAHCKASPDVKRSSSTQAVSIFMTALEGCSRLVIQICGENKKINVDYKRLDDASCKLLSSISLCSATLVRVTAQRCLPLLPRFMPQMVACLSSVNERIPHLVENDEDEDDGDENDDPNLEQARIVQVCLLRALTAVADTVPQFIYPYLKQLLAPSALPSETLRLQLGEKNVSVKYAAEGLEKSLCKYVPARVLLPAAAKAITNLQKPVEFEVLLRLLKHSIDISSGEELAGYLGSLLKAVTATYDQKCGFSDRTNLLEKANEAILAMVMKLSEVHLRRLFALLRDWRGDLDPSNPERFALRRHAFWAAAAVLSRELKIIFLPCLGSVFNDAVEELRLAQSQFCAPKRSEKIADGKKKRRLSGSMETITFTPDCMLSLEPLLLCLEYGLRADSQDGGKWIRAEDGQRYRALLEPLGKLLQSKIPEDFPIISETTDTSNFEYFVLGDDSGSGGNVVSCLTALASAAGNEQLWKPLNFAILDACGNSGRYEVRRAGLTCLLSLMKSLGEEYMVLLPECLPVLSELLEDNDEEVAGMAQDCITLGEDLLGESLEDSLR